MMTITVATCECVLVFLLFLQHLPAGSGNFTNTLWAHQCDPGSEIFACTVPNFLYKPNHNHSTLVAPGTVRKVRLAYPRDKILLRDNIVAYDAVLHEILKRPRAVQIANVIIKTVDLPPDLEYADFSSNMIATVSAPEVNGSEYALRYLDLQYNRMTAIDSLRALVHLETLLLAHNRIVVVDGSVLKGFPKLVGLHLGANQLEEFPYADLPATLEWLVLCRNDFANILEFTGMYAPALKVLNLQDNFLNSLNIDSLLAAAPNLKELLLRNEFIAIDGASEIVHKLQEAGIAHDKFAHSEQESDYDEEDGDGDSYHHSNQKHQAREYIFSGLLAVINVCVMAWGGCRLYKVLHSEK
ncbi:transforming growth factor beta activator LRRC32-like [Anopheles merus]|uniref:Leucine rich immune protein (Coil-less) n=1 Tax=Anopheles merus TaxID=30066 RepID=A0A182V9P3_ANOME|nr:transforming growth factor beta activator LRRC32-like [Anopheles merus]